MRRRILLVDDEVAVLLTLKAVLEISGFDVDTAASAREGVSKLHTREYHMLITDMRMEHDVAGVEVIQAARSAAYHPAIALLTAFPVAEEDWQEMGADQLLVKPMHTRILLQQIEDLIASHEQKQKSLGIAPNNAGPAKSAKKAQQKKSRARNRQPKRKPRPGKLHPQQGPPPKRLRRNRQRKQPPSRKPAKKTAKPQSRLDDPVA